jgi:predicted permease
MQSIWTDFVYSLRQFRISPVFTLTAAFTLALGIGGTTAIFSLIHAIMLRSLPVADPAALYRIGAANNHGFNGGRQGDWGMVSYPLFERLKTQVPEFENLTAFGSEAMTFSVRRSGIERIANPVRGEYVDGNYFPVLGIRSFVGRLLTPHDDSPNAPPAVVISYRIWQARFGTDPSIVGSTLTIEGHPFTVVGVTPPGFYGETLRSDPPDFWLPLQMEPVMNARNSLLHQSISAWLRVIGRFKPGATVDGMSARLTEFLHNWLLRESNWPPEVLAALKQKVHAETLRVVPAGSGVMAMKEEYSRTLYILLTVCGLVLLIACANIANLMLARAMTRRSSTSLRMALGASPQRMIRQALTESITLSLLGGVLGLLVADAAGRLILGLAFHSGASLPISTDPSLPILLFAFGASVLTGVLFGTAPAWFATRMEPVEALRGATRTVQGNASLPQRMLLVVQATLSVVLVAGAGMLTRSLSNQEHQNLGLATQNRIQIQLHAVPGSYSPAQVDALHRNLQERLRQIAGVEQAPLALYNPFTDTWSEDVHIQGRADDTKRSPENSALWDRITPDYFNAVGQKLLRGRLFTDADRTGSAPVAIVNEAFARRFFPNENAIGKHFGIDLPSEAGRFENVGVVSDAKYTDPNKPTRPMYFLPLAQRISYPDPLFNTIELRSHFLGGILLVAHRDVGALEPLVRRICSEVDPNLTVTEVRTMSDQIALQFTQQRAVASLASLFGIVALILAAVGLYGVTAYTVARRTREIGVRMALGAGRPSVIGMVLHGAFQNVLAGLVLGIPLAIGAGQLMRAQLYNLDSWDPSSLMLALFSLGIAALLAAIIPATRAAAIDPMQALRVE